MLKYILYPYHIETQSVIDKNNDLILTDSDNLNFNRDELKTPRKACVLSTTYRCNNSHLQSKKNAHKTLSIRYGIPIL